MDRAAKRDSDLRRGRALATKRMVADAVMNIRYTSSAVMQGAAEVIAYGTAVKFVSDK